MLRRYDRRLKTLFSALSVVFQSDYPGEVRRELQSKKRERRSDKRQAEVFRACDFD